jgi:transglutaminase-like putative cysteine protease
MAKRTICTFLLSLFFYCLTAQHKADYYLEKSKEVKKKYSKASFVMLESNSNYRFFIDPKKESTVAVENIENRQYLSLHANARYMIRSFYDDNSKISSYKITDAKGKKVVHLFHRGPYNIDNIFHSDAKIQTVSFKKALAGQVANYTSKKDFNDPKYLTKIFFHDDMPIEKRKIEIEIPDNINVELLEMNFAGYEIKKSESKTANGKKVSYSIDNIDEFPKDENTPGHLHFLPHLLVLTKSYTINNESKKVLASTDDLYAWYYSLIQELNNESFKLTEKVTEITSGSKSDEETIKRLFYWVQDNIKYIAFVDGLAGFKPEDAHKVFYNRYGDCKGMANLLKEMLIIASFDARLTWVGTTQIPYSYDVPSLAVDNHMICTVFSGGKKYILDPTEKYQSFTGIAERIQGKEILIENGDKYIRDKVPVEAISKNLEEKKVIFKLNGKFLTIEGEAKYSGEPLKIMLNGFRYIDSDKLDTYMRNIVSGSTNPNNFTISNHSDPNRDEPLKITFQASLDNLLNIYEKDVYISLDHDQDLKNLKFEDDRKAPFDFGRKINRKTEAEMLIPKGYKLQHVPKPLVLKNDNFEFQLRYDVKANKVTYIKEIKIYNSTISVSDFQEWNKAISQLNNFYNDHLVLQIIH